MCVDSYKNFAPQEMWIMYSECGDWAQEAPAQANIVKRTIDAMFVTCKSVLCHQNPRCQGYNVTLRDNLIQAILMCHV